MIPNSAQAHLFGVVLPPVVPQVLGTGRFSRPGLGVPHSEVCAARNAFRDAGVKVLGAGSFGIVLEHPEKDKVVKLVFCPWDGYVDYMDFVQHRAPDWVRPHLPVVHEHAEVDGVNVYVLERLETNERDIDEDSSEYEAYEYLKDEARPDDVGFDTTMSASSRNQMRRRDGTLVFTDPWFRSAPEDDDDI
jgi:hypothetical protein